MVNIEVGFSLFVKSRFLLRFNFLQKLACLLQDLPGLSQEEFLLLIYVAFLIQISFPEAEFSTTYNDTKTDIFTFLYLLKTSEVNNVEL